MSSFLFQDKHILITGGAGYIGSHVLRQLGQTQAKITIIDNLSTGHKEAVLCGNLIIGDIQDPSFLQNVFSANHFDAILHFAGSIIVPESITNPLAYYANNTSAALNLIQAAERHQVHRFIFSSTAAVYGTPKDGVCIEDSPLNPINPYGQSKLMTEQILKDFSVASDPFQYVILRYFNVAGADLQGRIGQASKNATHLIKVACEAITGKRNNISIYGTDYPTPDGTCIRDYIHVEDLANAHLLALKYLFQGGKSNIFNCGYQKGYSVKEVLDSVQKVAHQALSIQTTDRREGDPPILIANSQKIRSILGWTPQYNHLETIIQSALNFEKNGFKSKAAF